MFSCQEMYNASDELFAMFQGGYISWQDWCIAALMLSYYAKGV